MVLVLQKATNQGNYMMDDNKKYYEKYRNNNKKRIIMLKIKIVFNRLDGFIKK